MKLKIGLIIIGTLFLSSCMMMSPALMSGSMQQGQNLELSGLRMDPVCGNQVGEENNFTYEYKGNIYYFDTEQCLAVFKSNPDHFLQQQDMVNYNKTWVRLGWIGGAIVMSTMMILMLFYAF